VLYLTERAVFRLTDAGLLLTEIAPGVDLDRDVLAHMDFAPTVAPDLREMDPRIFREQPMGLSRDSLVDLDDRVAYHPEDNVLYVNLEGLHLDTAEQARQLASSPDRRPATLGRVHAVVNYDKRRTRPDSGGRLLHHDPRQHREALPQRDALLHERLLPPPTRRTLHQGPARADHLPELRRGPARDAGPTTATGPTRPPTRLSLLMSDP
jgi:hypothetical protein